MTTPLERVVLRLIKRVRPRAALQDVPLTQRLGWIARFGLVPLVRGTLRSPFLRGLDGPLFVGARVSIKYGGQIHGGRNLFLGSGTRINAFSRQGIAFGDGVTIRENAWIQCSSSPAEPGIGLQIGSGTYIGPGAIIGVGGLISVGEGCQVGSSVVLIAENHVGQPGAEEKLEVSRRGIVIGPGCWLGHRVTILDGVQLGERCVVGAGAVVTKSFPAGSKLGGVPARDLG